MLRTIVLLSPIFISLFWFFSLMGEQKKYSTPRTFLAWFMLIPFFQFTAYFTYFAPYPHIYPYFDVSLTYLGQLVFPLYHIYFRLLTVDEKFSLKSHARYLILPLILATAYAMGVLFTPRDEYRSWLYNENSFTTSLALTFLHYTRIAIRIHVLAFLLISIISNHLLIRKYAHRAEQFYSDIQDAKNINSKLLNYSIMAMSVGTFTAVALGRSQIMPQNLLVYLLWILFSVSLFVMGMLGLRLKPINPTFDLDTADQFTIPKEKSTISSQNELLTKILLEFEQNKIYLNSELNIMDTVKRVGTNRTYISTLINQQFNQNFCGFVNGYRIEELERLILQYPGCSITEYAERCGFGSVNSLKRSVMAKTELSFQDFKKQILSSKLARSYQHESA